MLITQIMWIYRDEAMNYQMTSIYFYSFKAMLWAAFCLTISFFGSPAPFLFLLILGIVFPVVISVRLHTLTEQGAVLNNSQAEEWLVFVNGIPVQETRRPLSNPFFYSTQRATQFFRRAFLMRAVIQALIIGWMLVTWPPYEMFIISAGMILALLIMLYSLIHTLSNLQMLNKNHWEIASLKAPGESEWFQAFFTWRKRRQGALESLLSQF
jgi:predicted DNA-binding transcriptional regulator